MDKSYFGGHSKYLKGSSVVEKVVVLGILKRQGRVYTYPALNVSREVLRVIIHQKVPQGALST